MRRILKLRAIVALGLGAAMLGATGFAQAATILFSDNFDDETPALSTTPGGWTTHDGNVDLIGRDSPIHDFYDVLPGNGVYVDMVGTDGNSGLGAIRTNQTFTFDPGVTYNLSYSLAGSQRGQYENNRPNSIEVVIYGTYGFILAQHTLGSAAAFQLFSQDFTVQSQRTGMQILFRSSCPTGNEYPTCNDNQGLLLDNVSLTAVPLPAAAWLLLSGLAGFGFVARRRTAA